MASLALSSSNMLLTTMMVLSPVVGLRVERQYEVETEFTYMGDTVMNRMTIAVCSVAIALTLSGCATTGGPPTRKRQAILSMSSEVLSELYKVHPQAQTQIAAAPGYAVFSNANIISSSPASAAATGWLPREKPASLCS